MYRSPYRDRIVAYVADNPGCPKLAVATMLCRGRRYGPTYMYSVVNTAIRRGAIRAERLSNRYSLTVAAETGGAA